MTLAQTVAKPFFSRLACTLNSEGNTIVDECVRHRVAFHRDGAANIYTFQDGSVIVVKGGSFYVVGDED